VVVVTHTEAIAPTTKTTTCARQEHVLSKESNMAEAEKKEKVSSKEFWSKKADLLASYDRGEDVASQFIARVEAIQAEQNEPTVEV